ncbi:MAG TPA: hypothetical protein VKI44_15505 [Acetobacteraceae bacterium]|nr:hypothetical protein [Acetobacteraceae bacterium]
MPLLVCVGLVLSGCATAPDYRSLAYTNASGGYEGYPYDPTYDSLGFGFGSVDHFHRFEHDRDFDHGHDGHGFAPFGGHGFAARGGFGRHRG